MKREYIRPEYENNNQLEDVILLSVQQDGDTITGVIDIEEIMGSLN